MKASRKVNESDQQYFYIFFLYIYDLNFNQFLMRIKKIQSNLIFNKSLSAHQQIINLIYTLCNKMYNLDKPCDKSHRINPTLENQYTEKMVVFEKESTKESTIVSIMMDGLCIIEKVLELIEIYCNVQENQIFMYDPQLNLFSPITRQKCIYIPQKYLIPQFLLIKYQVIEKYPKKAKKDNKDRSRERSIGESIVLVGKWRQMSQNYLDQQNQYKKLGLNEAAKRIGISKKSLDDYYYQLRLGQYYNFDFRNNLDQKIGILRAYVKEFKPERQEKTKNLRHPKRLKIIEMHEEIQSIMDLSPKKKRQSPFQHPTSQKVQYFNPNYQDFLNHFDNLQKMHLNHDNDQQKNQDENNDDENEYYEQSQNNNKYEILSISQQDISFQHQSLELIDEFNNNVPNNFMNNFKFSLDNYIDPFYIDPFLSTDLGDNLINNMTNGNENGGGDSINNSVNDGNAKNSPEDNGLDFHFF